MAKTEAKNVLGIYISPKEICIAQVKTGKDLRPEPEHLVVVPTGFTAKEGLLRPLSLNNDFFSEKASWLAPLDQAIKQVSWDTNSVVISLSPQFAILRYFVMPCVDRKYWNKSIPLESKKFIPVSFDEVVYDFDVKSIAEGKKLGVLFGLTQRKSVEFIISTLKAVGLELAGLEISPISLERLFGIVDAKGHDAKGYIHFSGKSSYMLFSHGGFPVLYRETDNDSSLVMSERKRLDVKGAVQFVDRYVGAGAKYQDIRLSGDGAAAWKPVAEKEAETIPASIWDPVGICGVKGGSVSSLFAIGAALRNKVVLNPRLDISGIGSAAKLEKEAQNFVKSLTLVIGGILLLLSAIGQARLSVINSRLSAVTAKLSNAPELLDSDIVATRKKIETVRMIEQVLHNSFSGTDTLAPKLSAITDNIPGDLWLTEIAWTNPLFLGDRQVEERSLRLNGETFLTKEQKTSVAEVFLKSLKGASEFQSFNAPDGRMELVVENAGANMSFIQDVGAKVGQIKIICTGQRK